MLDARRLIATAMIVAAVVTVGCAKRPALTAASAPAPAAATQVQPAPPPPPPAPAPAPALAPPAPVAPAPAPARLAPKEFAPVEALKPVYFDFDRYEIRPGERRTLDTNAQWLKANAKHLVLIEGHCDERGTNEYNLGLGERRARATMDYLVSQGVAANRFTIVSYGEERPVCTERNEACWKQNRRAAFLVKEQ